MSIFRFISYAIVFKLNLVQKYEKVSTLFRKMELLFKYFFHFAQYHINCAIKKLKYAA